MTRRQSGLASLASSKYSWVEDFASQGEQTKRRWNEEVSMWLLDKGRSEFFFSFPKGEQDSIFRMLAASFWASSRKGLSIETERTYQGETTEKGC